MKKILSLLALIMLLSSCTRTYIVWSGADLFGITIVILALIVIGVLYIKSKISDWLVRRAQKKHWKK